MKNSSIILMRDLCRQIGYKNYKINVHCSAEHWKIARSILISELLQHNSANNKCAQNKPLPILQTTALQKAFNKIFNLALREIKSGALCAMVDATRSNLRRQSHDGMILNGRPRASLKMSDPTQISKLYRNKNRRSKRNGFNSLNEDPRTTCSDSVETFLSSPQNSQQNSDSWHKSYYIDVPEFNLSLFDQTSPRSIQSEL
uniref:Uncharacterized protein n=1 Tax=Acrobeloides nanus TaxID=290746 RepID=A0A914D390_9BILA